MHHLFWNYNPDFIRPQSALRSWALTTHKNLDLLPPKKWKDNPADVTTGKLKILSAFYMNHLPLLVRPWSGLFHPNRTVPFPTYINTNIWYISLIYISTIKQTLFLCNTFINFKCPIYSTYMIMYYILDILCKPTPG